MQPMLAEFEAKAISDHLAACGTSTYRINHNGSVFCGACNALIVSREPSPTLVPPPVSRERRQFPWLIAVTFALLLATGCAARYTGPDGSSVADAIPGGRPDPKAPAGINPPLPDDVLSAAASGSHRMRGLSRDDYDRPPNGSN